MAHAHAFSPSWIARRSISHGAACPRERSRGPPRGRARIIHARACQWIRERGESRNDELGGIRAPLDRGGLG